ncbi:flagella associated protein [Trypanosoma grayi]|uniref:flagella associated protein n=1 Tax=Trypanosoma grayi TaxID=71804 RepID=UPI0004F47CA2|nr:flagella associated protein [Trypanosoma grayi]KEG09792.1 flagella associated protein [Trypanosoma grayi]
MSSPSCTVYDNSLGGTRPRRHIAPQIRAAGLVINSDCGTVAELTSNYYTSGRSTPDLIKSYRRGGDVGHTYRHYGRARDPPVDETVRYGVKNSTDGGAHACLQPDSCRMTALMDEQLERMYLSCIRRPLGHAPAPPYDVLVPRNGFGVTTDRSESVKRVVYGGKDIDVLDPVGARTDRGYDWARVGIDPTQHRFGFCPASDAFTSGDVMSESRPVTMLLPKLVKDFQATTRVEVGKPRAYGFHNAPFEETAERRAVRRTRHGDGDAAREVLSSWAQHPATVHAQDTCAVADALESTATATNAGGVSSGDDGSHSKTRSRFACTFGSRLSSGKVGSTELDDNVRVPHLLYPCHYVQMGVKSSYFAGGRPLEEVQDLCKKVNFGLTDTQVKEVFASIAQDGKCGIEQFKNKAVEMGYLA